MRSVINPKVYSSCVKHHILSKYFYGGVILFSTELIISWCLAKLIEHHKNKFILAISILPSLLLFVFTKYQNFFTTFSLFNPSTLKIILPLGISFFTLKIISCHVEIYRGNIQAPSLCDYMLYVSLFTQILSGPIMRVNDFIPQLTSAKFNAEQARSGAFMIIMGLFKKLLIANMAMPFVDKVHENISGVPALALWMSAFLYAVELYADFSGYSDISNGIMKIMGINVPANFNSPYFASGFRDFWNRWHISLSSWLRDYVYIPLGGSRCSEFRRFVNVMITFLISGLWHGTGLNFLFWGFSHGLLVYLSPKIKLLRSQIITFLLVMFLWIPFRAVDLSSAFNYIIRMFVDFKISMSLIIQTVTVNGGNTSPITMTILFTSFILLMLHDYFMTRRDYGFIFTLIFTSMTILFGKMAESAFIYAGF